MKLAILDKNVSRRFWDKVQRTGDDQCWEWKAACQKKGYGAFGIGKKVYGAHRISYELTKGKIPSGLWVLHKCDNPKCVNPNHLFLGTHADNVADMDAKGRRKTRILLGNERQDVSLNEKQVLEVFEKHWHGGQSQRQLAREYGVSRTVVAGVVNGKTWRHLDLVSSLGTDIKTARKLLNRTGKGYNRSAVGESNNLAKLTSQDVVEIRRRYSQGESQPSIAKKFNVSCSNVSAIVTFKSWRHI